MKPKHTARATANGLELDRNTSKLERFQAPKASGFSHRSSAVGNGTGERALGGSGGCDVNPTLRKNRLQQPITAFQFHVQHSPCSQDAAFRTKPAGIVPGSTAELPRRTPWPRRRGSCGGRDGTAARRRLRGAAALVSPQTGICHPARPIGHHS